MQPFGISMTMCGKGKVLDNNKIHMSCVIKILLDTGYFKFSSSLDGHVLLDPK